MSTGHFNGLTPEQAELLTLLAEESAEVVQSVTKILRHGLDSCHPSDPARTTNQANLHREVGQVLAAVEMLKNIGILETARLSEAQTEKMVTVRPYLHHHTPRGLSLDEVVMKHSPEMIADLSTRSNNYFKPVQQTESSHVFPVPPSAEMVVCGSYGCTNMKRRNAVFCTDCGAEYKLDPDAFK